MSTRAMVCLGVLLATPAVAGDLDKMEAAQRSLRQAKQQLREAGGGFDGHRHNAIERVTQALAQVEAALAVARQKHRGGQPHDTAGPR